MNLFRHLAYTPSIPELVIVLVIILVLFGPKKLPDLSRAIGKSIGEFKRGRREVDEELKNLAKEDEAVNDPKDGNLG
ncbi:twin-arginine translocase TatA/TatE family subunit [Kiritimatiellota bacterium B12222]|nr:twin-arginine translocase TatA/TatE family subunit [Kiritimatiellota bacterium B12222]